jgi:hypothetical protein
MWDRRTTLEAKQISNARMFIYRDMQIAGCNADIGVPNGVAGFGQRPPASERMADQRMAAVMDGQRLKSSGTERLARRLESLAKRVAGERLDGAAWDQLRQEWRVVFGAEPLPPKAHVPSVAAATPSALAYSRCETAAELFFGTIV